MIIQEEARRCVAFVGYQMADGSFRYAGTAFFLGDEEVRSMYAVTARHVIEGIKVTGLDQVYQRLNLKTGNSEWLPTSLKDWQYHPDNRVVDVAVLAFEVGNHFDHDVVSTKMCV